MKSLNTSVKTIEDYILSQTAEKRESLYTLYETIKKIASKAEEGISYQMPVFRLNGVLVYFGAAKNHIGFYPTPSAIIAFKEALKPYVTSKGAIQFPYDKKLPIALIKKIVKFRVLENQKKATL